MPVVRCRLVQLNVKRFTDLQGQSTVEAIAEALVALRPSLVCFNEVDINKWPGALKHISTRLGMRAEFFGHVRGRYGNALLSVLAITSTSHHHLRGGTEWALPSGTLKFDGELSKAGETHRIARGMLCAELKHIAEILSPSGPVREGYKEGEERGGETDVPGLDEGRPVIDILVGDFNALTRSDYTGEQWQALEHLHKANGWAGPVAGCLDVLKEEGFVDCLDAARTEAQSSCKSGGGAQDSMHNVEREPVFTTPAHEPRVRVDYCFVRGAGVTVDKVMVLGEESGQHALSDHRAIVVDLLLSGHS